MDSPSLFRGPPSRDLPVVEAAPLYKVGCLALSPELRQVVWPPKFHLDVPKYDEAQDPAKYLQLYTTAVHAAGGSEKVMANWFPLVLKGAAQSWLMNLPPTSIRSWQELCDQFIGNFQGTCKCAEMEEDLYAVEHRSDETLR